MRVTLRTLPYVVHVRTAWWYKRSTADGVTHQTTRRGNPPGRRARAAHPGDGPCELRWLPPAPRGCRDEDEDPGQDAGEDQEQAGRDGARAGRLADRVGRRRGELLDGALRRRLLGRRARRRVARRRVARRRV